MKKKTCPMTVVSSSFMTEPSWRIVNSFKGCMGTCYTDCGFRVSRRIKKGEINNG